MLINLGKKIIFTFYQILVLILIKGIRSILYFKVNRYKDSKVMKKLAYFDIKDVVYLFILNIYGDMVFYMNLNVFLNFSNNKILDNEFNNFVQGIICLKALVVLFILPFYYNFILNSLNKYIKAKEDIDYEDYIKIITFS